MAASPEEFKRRTKKFALQIIRLVESLPRNCTADVLGRQLLRAGTSVGANYRAACRARSASEFSAKMGIVDEEADECIYWLELLIEADLATGDQLRDLLKEANEITAMVVASIRTVRQPR
jgi:four helix bundle protein